MKNQFLFVVLFLMCILNLSGEIKDHLKSADNKSNIHQIPNVDFIYMINLDQRPEKFAKSLNQLMPYGIYPYRFSAVNGWELNLQEINDVGVRFESWMPRDLMATTYLLDGQGEPVHEIMHDSKRAYFCHTMAKGAIGICLSHLSVLQDAYDAGYATIWVMEDDIYVCRNPNEISDAIARLDRLKGENEWDILFTDRDIHARNGEYVVCMSYARRPNFTPDDYARAGVKEDIGLGLRAIGARYGAHSMIVRRSGIKKILDFIYKYSIYLPYDMEWQNIPDLKMFTVLEDVVTNLNDALSDNGHPYYKLKNQL